MTCHNAYCANSGIPRGCYEVVMGFLCDDCERQAEREASENESRPECGEDASEAEGVAA